MKTLNLEVKMIEKPSEIKDLKRGDIVPIHLSHHTDTSLSYRGLALCLSSGKSTEIGFLELQFGNNLILKAHYISKNSLLVLRNYIVNMPGHKYSPSVIEVDRHRDYNNEDFNLLQEVLNKAK